jgi:Na+(H+)/acetate symporter ActP
MVIITGMASTVTDALNWFNQFGGFSYVIPFLLIFAVMYAILEKSGILGDNKGIMVIVSISIGLLSLQFDFVPEFFAVIFPRFGVGISIFLALIIFIGFFWKQDETHGSWIGYVIGIGIAIWALSSWDQWGRYGMGFGGWFAENIWALLVLGVVIGMIVWMTRGEKKKSKPGAQGPGG